MGRVFDFDEICDLVRNYYNNMEEIEDPNRRRQIKEWVTRADMFGDNEAKQNLVTDLKVVLGSKGIELGTNHSIYPDVPAYECVIFRTYGLGIYDAVINKSPNIESVMLSAGHEYLNSSSLWLY